MVYLFGLIHLTAIMTAKIQDYKLSQKKTCIMKIFLDIVNLTKPELRFFAGLNPAGNASEICDGDNDPGWK